MTIGLAVLSKEDRREEITRMWKLGKIPLPGGWELIEKDEWYLSTGSSTDEKDIYVAQFWDPQARGDVLRFALALYGC